MAIAEIFFTVSSFLFFFFWQREGKKGKAHKGVNSFAKTSTSYHEIKPQL